MEKLIELANAGIEVAVFGPYQYAQEWRLTANKTDTDGTKLEIKSDNESLLVAIDDLYDRWIRATRNGMPNLTLLQIEHAKVVEDFNERFARPSHDEIPF